MTLAEVGVVVALAIVLISTALAFVFKKLYTVEPCIGVPALTVSNTLLGNAPEIAEHKEIHLAQQKWREQINSGVYTIRIFFKQILIVTEPEFAQFVTNHLPKANLYQRARVLMGDGLVFSSGSKWQKHRRLLNPGFQHAQLTSMVPAFASMTTKLVQQLEDRVRRQADDHPDHQVVVIDIGDEFTRLTCDIICWTGFGYRLGALDGKNTEVCEAFGKLLGSLASPLIAFLPFGGWIQRARLQREYNAVNRVLYDCIDLRTKQRQSANNNNNNNKDLLDLLMDARDAQTGEGLTRTEIRDELFTFFLAGHETTSTTLTWAFSQIAQHPEIQQKIIDEVDSVLGGSDSITAKDLGQFNYITMVLKETLRMYPPAANPARKTQEPIEYKTKEGLHYKIPAGQEIMFSIYSLHHDPKYWPEPEKFDPERFDPAKQNEEPAKSRPHACYMPFSYGPRNCIGQNFFWIEAKVIMALFFRRFTIRMAAGHEDVGLPRTNTSGTLHPEKGVKITIHPRI